MACAAALAALATACAPQSHEPDARSVTAAVEAWRAKHEADYRRDWVTIAGLHFLNPGAQTAGSAANQAIVLPMSASRFARHVSSSTVRPCVSNRRQALPWICKAHASAPRWC